MFNKKYFYVLKVQYLGYRFHGWQKQPNLKTVHLMIDRTLNYIFDGKRFKTLGSGRTDAMVSAQDAAFELFVYDIRALSIKQVDEAFNIINQAKIKEYLYVFAQGQKHHPFCAPIMTTILEELDLELMKQGAKLFEGFHNFKTYCYKATDNGIYEREILTCEIVENNIFTANFFPKTSYLLRVRGQGFMRNQIRLMMGALIKLGRGEISLDYIEASLTSDSIEVMDYIAPASGLILNKIEFD